MHVAKCGPVDLEGDAQALVLTVTELVFEGALPDVVHVASGALQVLTGRPQMRELVHF